MRKACLTALLAIALTSCGGNNNSGDGSGGGGGGGGAATQSTEGIWNGTIHSNVSGQDEPVTMIFLPTGEARIIENNCVQFVMLTSTSAAFFTGSGNGYAPDGGISACPVALTFPNGSATATVTLSGQATTRQLLIGSYGAGGDTGNFNVTYNTAYGRVGTLARIAGTYSNGTMAITIDANGAITGTLGSFMLMGQVSTIDVTKNAYRISITEFTTTTTTSTTATSGATPASAASTTTSTSSVTLGDSWAGLATLLDYSSSTDNYLTASLSSQKTGFSVSLVRQ